MHRLACTSAIILFLFVLSSGTSPPPPPPLASPVDEGLKTEADLEVLFRDNLAPDLAVWADQGLTMQHLEDLMKAYETKRLDTTRLLLIYNNTIFFPLQKNVTTCQDPCNHLLRDVEWSIRRWSHDVTFPNTLFMMSVADANQCSGRNSCPAPFLSFAKRLRPSLPTYKDAAYDILVPKPPKRWVAFYHHYPWELKENRAVWRGTRWCDGGTPQHMVGCSRFYMHDFYKNTSKARELIDFGFTAGTNDQEVMAKPLTTADFARYKFILNLDGFTAAYRFSKLLLINSVVLKEDSYKGEYFYRSLKEYEHFIPVFKHNATDILDIIKEYSKPERLPDLQRISKAAQEFSTKYCCPKARMLYWVRALKEFKKLFPDMDQAIETKWWPLVKSKLPGGLMPARAQQAQGPGG